MPATYQFAIFDKWNRIVHNRDTAMACSGLRTTENFASGVLHYA